MPEIVVRLTATEMMVAAYVGSARNVQSLTRDWEPAAGIGFRDTWTPNIEGAAGEIAVGKALNIYWQPIVGNNRADDVGPYQVRTNTSRKHADLCLRPKDRADRIFISVLSFAPVFRIVGWVWARDGKVDRWLRDGTPDRPKCYYVPMSALNDMGTLPRNPVNELVEPDL
jgi:hypothetical protein